MQRVRLVTVLLLVPVWLAFAPFMLIAAGEQPGRPPLPAPGLSPPVWLAVLLIFHAPPVLALVSLGSLLVRRRA